MERIYFITHKNKNILFLDNSNATEEESVKLAKDFHNLAINYTPKSLLVLHNLVNAPGSHEAAELWKEYAVEHYKYIIKTAVIVEETLQKSFVVSFRNNAFKKGIKDIDAVLKAFDYNNIIDAKNWLVWEE